MYHVYIADTLIITSIRMFVLLVGMAILLAEVWSGGVGAFLVFSSLTGIPLSSWRAKGFSGKILSGMLYVSVYFQCNSKLGLCVFIDLIMQCK